MAGRPVSPKAFATRFQETIAEIRHLHGQAGHQAISISSRRIKWSVYELAHIRLMSAWEDTLQHIFLRQLVADTTQIQALYGLAAPPRISLGVARAILDHPDAQVLSWSDWGRVKARAARLLPPTSTFLSTSPPPHLQDMTKVRNACAHPRGEAYDRFLAIVQGPKQGWRPGRFLCQVTTVPPRSRADDYLDELDTVVQRLV